MNQAATLRFLLEFPFRVLIFLGLLFLPARLGAQSLTQVENAKAGSPDWQLTNPATNHEIEGYASLVSVGRGEQISFFVNTADPTFTLEIFRMGWYRGDGARLVTPAVQLTGTVQTIPKPDPTTGMIECQWSNPYTITITDDDDHTDWASGVYLARLTGSNTGKQSYILFIVRDDARSSTYVFQVSTNTFEAYNNWGGKSLYNWNSTNSTRATSVSYNRPYALGDQSLSASGVGAADFLTNFQPAFETAPGGWSYNLIRFLEREGYDVSYISDVDAHENASLLLSHKTVLVVGHSEYWSWEMRANVQAARDAGVGLGFFSSNTCYWQIRFGSSAITGAPDRTIICYKSASTDPYASSPSTAHLTTVQWRAAPVNMPEEAFIGVMYATDPVNGDIVVTNASDWVYTYTGLQNGDHLKGLLGYEIDGMHGGQPTNTVSVAHETTTSGVPSDMTVYLAGSGATVFATGSFQWSWGLDDYNAPTIRPSVISPAAQQITRNVLARMAGQPLVTAFSIVPSPRRLVASWGSSVAFTVAATTFGYSPTLKFSLTGLPAGVSYTFSPATLTGSATSTLTITPTATCAPGTYVLTISATDGTQTRTESVTITIHQTLSSISISPDNQTLTVGGSQQYLAMSQYSDGSTEDVTSQANWTSSNVLAASINSAGLGTGIGPGISMIGASLAGVSAHTFLTVEAPATIRYVQSNNAVSSQMASSVSASFSSNTTAANTIIVAVSTPAAAISSVEDTQGNLYVQAVNSGVEEVIPGTSAIWYATNIKGGADTITANFVSPEKYSLIYIHEYSGLAKSASLDQAASLASSGEGIGTSVLSGPVTTTQANELLFGYASVQYSVKSGTNGFNVRQTAGGNMSEDMIVSMIGSYTATFTQTTSGTWAGLIATFKAAPSGTPPTLQSITVTPADPTVTIGGSALQLAAKGTFSDSSIQDVTGSCSWSGSATGVATVTSGGQVTGAEIGSANITCVIGSVNGFTKVTVTAALANIRYVQSMSSVSSQTAGAVSVSFSNNTMAGDAIIVAASAWGPTINSVTDTQGNIFVRAVALGNAAIWFATNIKGGADTVTANFSSTAGFSSIYIHEYAEVASSSALDQVSSQSGTGTAVTSGAKTITQGSELIFGYAAVDHRVSGGGVGFTTRQILGGNMSEDMIAPSAGTYAATFTQSFSGGWTGLMATFKAGPSGPQPALQSIAVTPSHPTIPIGGSPLQLMASGTFSDSSQQDVTSSCIWSSATGVATVNSLGQVTGVTAGSANLTCTVGSVNGFTTVTVNSALAAKQYLQSANSVSKTNSTAVSTSFTNLTTAGNAIVVAVSTSGPAISTVSDTQGNTFVRAVGSGSASIWYATNIHGGADTVTANFPSPAGFSLIYIHEYAGIAASSALDQVSSQSGTGTAVTSGAKTITSGNELIFGFAAVDHRVSGAGTGFTTRQTAGGNMSADMIVPSVGTYAATFTQSFSGGWTALLATFR